MSIHSSKRAHQHVPSQDVRALSASVHNAPKVRLKAGGQYLHWSGGFLTSNPEHAWSGSIEQAAACRRKFDAAAGCRTVEA